MSKASDFLSGLARNKDWEIILPCDDKERTSMASKIVGALLLRCLNEEISYMLNAIRQPPHGKFSDEQETFLEEVFIGSLKRCFFNTFEKFDEFSVRILLDEIDIANFDLHALFYKWVSEFGEHEDKGFYWVQ